MAPDLPIVDAHHYLWVERAAPYLLDEFAADVGDDHRITATVFVHAGYGSRPTGPPFLAPVGETEKVVATAADARARGMPSRVAAAILAFANLTRGTRVGAVLGAHAVLGQGYLARHSPRIGARSAFS